MAGFWAFVTNLTRVGLAGGAVKVTKDQGVWDTNTDNGRRIYEQAKEKILPGTIEYPKQLPTVREVQLSAQSYWNKAVQTSFDFIKNAPESARGSLVKLLGEPR